MLLSFRLPQLLMSHQFMVALRMRGTIPCRYYGNKAANSAKLNQSADKLLPYNR